MSSETPVPSDTTAPPDLPDLGDLPPEMVERAKATAAGPCPCGSGAMAAACCLPVIGGARPAETAEALMRSRYTAFTLGLIDWLQASLSPDVRDDFDRDHITSWSLGSEWLGLEVRRVEGGGPADTEGTVEFVARFAHSGKRHAHHETGHFVRGEQGQWTYRDGVYAQGTVRREAPKVGRNDPCPCGSGKKFKKCCGAG